MKLKGNLAGMVIGAVAATASLASCEDRPEVVIHPVSANEGGAGGATSSGGMGGSGNSGTGGMGSSVDYPNYLDSIETHTTPEAMELIDCMVDMNYELQDFNGTAKPRAGIKIIGTSWCGYCKVEREEIGREGMIKLAVNGMYLDPEFNQESMNKVVDVGVYGVPANNIVSYELFPTTNKPEGRPVMNERKWEGLAHLQDLADLTGCVYDSSGEAAQILPDMRELEAQVCSLGKAYLIRK